MPLRRAPVSRSFEWDIPLPVVDRLALDDLFSVTYEELGRLTIENIRGVSRLTERPARTRPPVPPRPQRAALTLFPAAETLS
jgi:hypothetical protein